MHKRFCSIFDLWGRKSSIFGTFATSIFTNSYLICGIIKV